MESTVESGQGLQPPRTPRDPANETLGQRTLAVLRHYGDLGFISFGGPGVHVILLRKRFVDQIHWVDLKTFTDLFSLGNALPGPGSTQLAFSIAVVRQGVLPGLLAFFLWSLPGALGMAGLAAGVSRIPDQLPGIVLALLTGLNAAAVGLIALAAVQLANAAITDPLTRLILWLSASFGICYHAPWMYPTLIAAGGASTLVWDFRRQIFVSPAKRLARRREARREDEAAAAQTASEGVELHELRRPQTAASSTSRRALSERMAPNGRASDEVEVAAAATPDDKPNASTPGARSVSNAPVVEEEPAQVHLRVIGARLATALLAGFVLLLVIPIATRAGLKNAGKAVPRGLDFFTNMLIAGTIIFGGGPVVIPLLRDYVVAEGWVSSRDFLLVFAILQAWPGPNFNFAVALGVPANPQNRALGALLGYLGIFSPGIVLKLGLLPVYSTWRTHPIARAVLRGLNAAASGLVFTAVWQLFLVGYIYQSASGQGNASAVSGPLTSDPFWAVVASGSFVASMSFKSPAWASIAGGGLAGLAWYGVQRS